MIVFNVIMWSLFSCSRCVEGTCPLHVVCSVSDNGIDQLSIIVTRMHCKGSANTDRSRAETGTRVWMRTTETENNNDFKTISV